MSQIVQTNKSEQSSDSEQLVHRIFTQDQLVQNSIQINSNIIINQNIKNKIINPLKNLVSKHKKRITTDGFDLDLCYIKQNIIAMGFPSQGIQSIYRNSLTQVKQLDTKIITKSITCKKRLISCAQKNYQHKLFKNMVQEFPFSDHKTPKFHSIVLFCQSHKWLTQDINNVAAIHCKAGKGRTGLMISCYLLYSNTFQYAADALRFFGIQRTKNIKGVTIPSQIRYVFYFQKYLKVYGNLQRYLSSSKRKIYLIKLHTVPMIDIYKGCQPYFILNNQKNKYESNVILNNKKHIETKHYRKQAYIKFLPKNLIVKNDFEIVFYHKNILKDQILFKMEMNSAFMTDILYIDKLMIDKCHKDKFCKKFKPNFTIEIISQPYQF